MLWYRKTEPRPRQEAPRRALAPPLIVQRVGDEDESRTFFGYATNLSSGGLFIGATNPKEPGTRFRLEIPFPEPDGGSVCCLCEVIWSRRSPADWTMPPGMGLRFVDLAADDALAIQRWVEDVHEAYRLRGSVSPS